MKDRTFSIIFAAIGTICLAVSLYFYTDSAPNPVQYSTDSSRPHFIHPCNADCALVIGTEGSETQVYLCRTIDNEYYYVRVVEATTISEGKVWTENNYEE